METAAKKKNSLALVVIASMVAWVSACLLSSAASASSATPTLTTTTPTATHVALKSRAEFFLGVSLKSVERSELSPANATRYYDSLEGVVLECIVAPVNVLDDAAKAQGKVVGSFKIDLTNPPPQGWRHWTTPYSPKFANPRIVDPATGLKVPTSALGSKTGLHELQHFLDATQHPQLYYFARASNAPGAGLAHFVFETRGYLQSHGLQALFNPSRAMASVRHAGRAHLVYRDLAGLAGLGGLGGFVYGFTSNEGGQQ